MSKVLMAASRCIWGTLALLLVQSAMTSGEAGIEGAVYDASAPAIVQWHDLDANRTYGLSIASGEQGASIDIVGLGNFSGGPAPVSVRPGGIEASAFRPEAPFASLNVTAGAARMAVTRWDFMSNLPNGRPLSSRIVTTDLRPGDCRLYRLASNWMREDALLHGRGTGLHFAVYDTSLQVLQETDGEGVGRLVNGKMAGVLLQACNPRQSVVQLTVEETYPVPAEATRSGLMPDFGPALGVVVLAALALVMLRRWRGETGKRD